MSAALRLVDCSPPSMRPTLVPPPRPTLIPVSTARATEPPSTQRSATVHPRGEVAARHEAYGLLATLRLNADFLGSVMGERLSPDALSALEELHRGIDRLEQRFASSTPLLPRTR
jgi:hypothetical protein